MSVEPLSVPRNDPTPRYALARDPEERSRDERPPVPTTPPIAAAPIAAAPVAAALIITARDRDRALAKEVRRGVLAAKNGLEAWAAAAEGDASVARRDLRFAAGLVAVLKTIAALLFTWGSEEEPGVIRPGDSRTLHP